MDEKKTLNKDLTVGEIFKRMMRAWGFQEKIKEMDVIDAWPELMGKGIAYRTERLFINNKILHIKLNSSVMRDELKYGKKIIIQRVNDFAGSEIITDVWLE